MYFFCTKAKISNTRRLKSHGLKSEKCKALLCVTSLRFIRTIVLSPRREISFLVDLFLKLRPKGGADSTKEQVVLIQSLLFFFLTGLVGTNLLGEEKIN